MKSHSSQALAADFTFTHVVALEIDGRWRFVETVDQALECLHEEFIGHDGPSFRRALNTCEAVFAGLVPAEGMRAAFVVAAMEAGYPFEVHARDQTLLERRIDVETENALIDVLMHTEP
ncbi:MAG: DUF982 domain-containing protein [Hyphomicrobiales bacterium]|nr:MAG: DUF982 domain-containing protein [Hyphomicrobiales bacterium]